MIFTVDSATIYYTNTVLSLVWPWPGTLAIYACLFQTLATMHRYGSTWPSIVRALPYTAGAVIFSFHLGCWEYSCSSIQSDYSFRCASRVMFCLTKYIQAIDRNKVIWTHILNFSRAKYFAILLHPTLYVCAAHVAGPTWEVCSVAWCALGNPFEAVVESSHIPGLSNIRQMYSSVPEIMAQEQSIHAMICWSGLGGGCELIYSVLV